ncbi:MAG: cytidine deaminase [Candidatus Velamenicoccus archaeovorus]
MSDQTVDDLVSAARAAMPNAYAPYSRFSVGAAVLAGGRVFVGVNVENASYPQGVCAERAAVAAAVAAGQRSIDAVAVVSSAPGDAVTPPCGGCRQVLNEFGPDMLVISEAADGTRRRWRLSELLPDAFGPHDLA